MLPAAYPDDADDAGHYEHKAYSLLRRRHLFQHSRRKDYDHQRHNAEGTSMGRRSELQAADWQAGP